MSAKERLTAVVSTMGEVILPKVVRQRRDWPAGTRLMVEEFAAAFCFAGRHCSKARNYPTCSPC